MAGKLRYWKEKDGRFFARIAVPKALQPFLDRPRSELIEALGGDRRIAVRLHPAAVARLQHEITRAMQRKAGEKPSALPPASITTQDFGRAVWSHYQAMLEADDATRAAYPSAAEIETARDEVIQRFQRNGMPDHPIEVFSQTLDWQLKRSAREFDQNARKVKLETLRRDLAADRTHLVEHEIDDFLTRSTLTAPPGSAERRVLARQIMRADIEALERTLERDQGNYGGQPTDPIVKAPAALRSDVSADPVSLAKLWSDYRDSRVQAGMLKDGGKRQEPVFRNLIAFLKHDNAFLVTKKDLIAWRYHLLTSDKLSAKTVSDIYLSTVRSVLAWAHDNERLSQNVAEKVKQPKPRRVDSREKGYTDQEAEKVLRASRSHMPKANQFGYIRETAHMTAAKRWAPILAAFSGARISEITQLRKEDVRQEGDRWIMRITPDAGSVKAGGYRDVPLHRQVIALGFGDFVNAANPGPLFHGSKDPENFAAAAQTISDELAKWLRDLKLVPAGVRPNYGWRHRLKTQALELGLTMRVIDAMQGHSGRTAGENYGDVTVIAKARVIDALPAYKLN